jgi:hypothetical protein
MGEWAKKALLAPPEVVERMRALAPPEREKMRALAPPDIVEKMRRSAETLRGDISALRDESEGGMTPSPPPPAQKVTKTETFKSRIKEHFPNKTMWPTLSAKVVARAIGASIAEESTVRTALGRKRDKRYP